MLISSYSYLLFTDLDRIDKMSLQEFQTSVTEERFYEWLKQKGLSKSDSEKLKGIADLSINVFACENYHHYNCSPWYDAKTLC